MDFNDLDNFYYDFNDSLLHLTNSNLDVYAHSNELLSDHLKKTKLVFENLVDENVLLNFYNYFHAQEFINISYDCFKQVIEKFIFFHDVGKISFNFQINVLNKKNFQIKNKQLNIIKSNNLSILINKFDIRHSLSGSLSFILYNDDLIQGNELLFIILSYIIYEHHTFFKDVSILNFNFDKGTKKEKISKHINALLISLFLGIISVDEFKNIKRKKFQNIQKIAIKHKTPNNSNFSFFYNYLYSLLISSDVIASKYYADDLIEISQINYDNRIGNKLKSKMIKSFNSVIYNSDVNYEEFIEDLTNIEDINILRKNMFLESSLNLKNNLSNSKNKVFFLNMPTGGGKTNTSMKLALDLIENTSANRIIYAMPFINIIEQNYDIIKNNFGLNEENSEIRKIYSATETIFDENDDEFKSRIILQDSLFNYPVICTTFSTFFDGILRNNKRNKYKLSFFANSVVILDEIQSLPLKNWNSLYYIISEISDKFNIYFIIMSATLPKFDKLKLDKYAELEYDKSVQLINYPQKYFDHYLFDRTEIKGNITELNLFNKSAIKNFLSKVIKENFNIGYSKGLIVLNTIKSSKLIYDILNEMDIPNLEIDLLNSSLLYNVKKEIIFKINNLDMDKNKKYILISTQSVEAGVDVSFDFVIRDFSILDSIEQVRGRCNRSRELNKKDPNLKGNIYLIKLKDKRNYLYTYIYNEEELNSRVLETQNLLNNKINYDYNDIMNYYDNVSDNINQMEDIREDNFILNDRENIFNWNNMLYSKLQDKNDGIHIIDNKLNQYSLFIPTIINICTNFEFNFENIDELKGFYQENKEKFIFSYKEIVFLRDKQKNSNYVFIENDCINGYELIKFYKEYIENFNKNDFEGFKIIKKEFSSIINKFIINFTLNDINLESKILDENDSDFEKFGYFYIMDPDLIGDDEFSLYSIKKGINYNFNNVEIL